METAATPTPEELVSRAREMIPQIAARAREARLARRVAEQTISEIEGAGFFRILQPARWGGYEMKPQVFYDVLIALAEADMSAGWVYGVLGVHPWLMGLMDDRAAREVWGSDNTARLCSSLMPVGRGRADRWWLSAPRPLAFCERLSSRTMGVAGRRCAIGCRRPAGYPAVSDSAIRISDCGCVARIGSMRHRQ